MSRMKKFKRFVSAAAAVIFALGTITGCGSTSSSESSSASASAGNYDNHYCENGKPSAFLTELRKRGVIYVGSSGDSFSYIDKDTNEYSGIDAVILKEAAKRLGIPKVEMKLMNFSELIVNLNENNIDIIADGMYSNTDVSAERAKQIYFGDTWYKQGGTLVVPEDSKINSVDDFDPKSTVVGYTEGTIWQPVVQKWQDDGLIKEARATGDQSSSLTAMQYGKIDAYLSDAIVMEDMKQREPASLKGLRFAENYKDTEATIGYISPSVSFEHIQFMKELNNAIEEMRKEGFMKKALKECGLDPKLHEITDEKYYTCKVNTRDE